MIAASGLDAFAQLVEPFVSSRANPLVDALCREGIARSARSLRRAFEGDRSEGVRDGPRARQPVRRARARERGAGRGARLRRARGRHVRRAARRRVRGAAGCGGARQRARARVARPGEPGARSATASSPRIVTGRSERDASQDGVDWVGRLVAALRRCPASRSWGAGEADVPALVAKAAAASSMKGNPIALTRRRARRDRTGIALASAKTSSFGCPWPERRAQPGGRAPAAVRPAQAPGARRRPRSRARRRAAQSRPRLAARFRPGSPLAGAARHLAERGEAAAERPLERQAIGKEVALVVRPVHLVGQE